MQLRERYSGTPRLRRIRGLRQMIHRDRDGPWTARENPLHPGPRQRLTPIESHRTTHYIRTQVPVKVVVEQFPE